MVQETFLSALERIDQFDDKRGTMLTWLKYTARNCIRAALRDRARLAFKSAFVTLLESLSDQRAWEGTIL